MENTKDKKTQILPNRHSNIGDMYMFVDIYPVEDDLDNGMYIIDLKYMQRTRIVRTEQIVTDNLSIFYHGDKEKKTTWVYTVSRMKDEKLLYSFMYAKESDANACANRLHETYPDETVTVSKNILRESYK